LYWMKIPVKELHMLSGNFVACLIFQPKRH
jgi:hypothetical protein